MNRPIEQQQRRESATSRRRRRHVRAAKAGVAVFWLVAAGAAWRLIPHDATALDLTVAVAGNVPLLWLALAIIAALWFASHTITAESWQHVTGGRHD